MIGSWLSSLLTTSPTPEYRLHRPMSACIQSIFSWPKMGKQLWQVENVQKAWEHASFPLQNANFCWRKRSVLQLTQIMDLESEGCFLQSHGIGGLCSEMTYFWINFPLMLEYVFLPVFTKSADMGLIFIFYSS